MLSPAWIQIQIGPLLRRESDLRFYLNLFKKKPEDIGAIRRTWLQVVSRKISEPQDFKLLPIKDGSRNTVIVFSDTQDYFQRLNGWDQFLLREIQSITKDRWLKEADSISKVPIGIHVRRGDFSEPKSDEEFYVSGSLRTPLSWFIKSLKIIRDVLGFPARAFVVSESGEKELRDLLSLKDTILFRTGSAISDLLFLSKAKILIGSGGSTFSAWAAFLGQMPTIAHPGQSLAWFKLINRKGCYLGEFDPNCPPQSFIDQIRAMSELLAR